MVADWNDLPLEIVLEIFDYVFAQSAAKSDKGLITNKEERALELEMRCKLSLVSKQWKAVVWMSNEEVDFGKWRSFHKSNVVNSAIYCVVSRASPKILNLSDCRMISDEALRYIANFCGQRLEVLNLNGSGESITFNGLDYLFSQCSYLREIDLSLYHTNSDVVNDSLIQVLANKCKTLRRVTFKSALTTDEPLSALSELPLEKLHIPCCIGLTANGLTNLMSKCPLLTDLDISSNPNFLNNQALNDTFLQHWSRLKILNLSGSTDINEQTVSLMLPFISGVQYLQLNRTEISENAIERLCRRLPQLRNLEFRSVQRIYPKFLRELAECYPDLKWTHFYSGRLTTSERMKEEIEEERKKIREHKRALRRRLMSAAG